MSMELIFEIGINLLETFLIVEFMTRYLGCKYSGIKRNICFLLGWFAVFAELCVRNYLVELETLSSIIPIALYVVYCVVALKGSFLSKVWTSVLIHMIVVVIAALTVLMICNVIGYDPYSLISVFNGIRILTVLMTKIILFYVCRLILKIKHSHRLDNNTLGMLIINPLISVLSLAFLMKATVEYEEIKGYILIGMLSIIISNIVTYFFCCEMNKQNEAKIRVKLLEKQNENALKSIEDSKAFVSQMRTVKHDIKNQLVTIANYIDSEKYEKAGDYIKSLTDNYLPGSREYINTDCDAFNAVINTKAIQCEAKGIFLEVKLSGEIRWYVKSVDLVGILGNLLDNAIEACEKTNIKRICVEVSHKGDYLQLTVINTIASSVLKNNEQLATSKPDKAEHGIGLKSVKSIMKKYDGFWNFEETENEFKVSIFLSEPDY